MKIGNIELLSDAVLAPIAGFTDVGLRNVAKSYGAGLTYTEMISCKGMVYGSEKTRELLATTEIETPCAVQIFGCDPEIMARAVVMPEIQKFDIIDINMGCPVPKVVGNGEGSALLNDPKLASEVVKSVISASGKPVTVKFRKGFRMNENTAVDFARFMQDAGVSAITVHGRTREQFYSGKADWDCIAEVVRAVDVPVFANGDVVDVESYKAIKSHTGASGVMIARGALGNPQIFRDIALSEGFGGVLYDTVDCVRDLLTQINVLSGYYTDRYIYSSMKKQVCYYLRGVVGGKAIKEKVCRVESLGELIEIVESLKGVINYD